MGGGHGRGLAHAALRRQKKSGAMNCGVANPSALRIASGFCKKPTGMNFPSLRLPSAAGALMLFLIAPAGADPLAELASFSAFKEIPLEKLAGGAVQSARGPTMSFPRGLAVENVYVVRKPLAKAAELHQQWSPVRHPELKVFLHGDLSGRPRPADFQKLASAPAHGAVKSFVAATQKLGSGATELQLSSAELKMWASGSAPALVSGGALPPPVGGFWSAVLSQRAQAFLSGGLSRLPGYEMSKEPIRAAEEVARLLKESGKVRGQFASLIASTPLTGGRASLSPSAYWELADIEGQATVTLGASYYRPGADTWQAVDGQYYSSGGYYVLLTFYQLWPVKIGGQDCTLCWRGDLISAASLATLRGVERMGSGTTMMRETKKSVESLLKDARKAP